MKLPKTSWRLRCDLAALCAREFGDQAQSVGRRERLYRLPCLIIKAASLVRIHKRKIALFSAEGRRAVVPSGRPTSAELALVFCACILPTLTLVNLDALPPGNSHWLYA